jgi:hypothetical protein
MATLDATPSESDQPILDSGASHTMCRTRGEMSHYSPARVAIRLANKATTTAVGTGTALLSLGNSSISRQLSRYYHDMCEKCSFAALLDMDGVSHSMF